MLNLRHIDHLTKRLGISLPALEALLAKAGDSYETLILCDPAKPEKSRPVLAVTGQLRHLQEVLYRAILKRALHPSQYSHGGVPGRGIRSNVWPHRKSRFVFKTDISDFYPSVHHTRIHTLFLKRFGCCPEVARICTKLCTYRGRLALGLVTSPILADQILFSVDARIATACENMGLVYTRYVDDVTISGAFDLRRSGIGQTISDILCQEGFTPNANKNHFGPLCRETEITGLRLNRGQIDVTARYIRELDRQITDAGRLATDQPFEGPYYTDLQILGRIHFVGWVNPKRRSGLMARYNAIKWNRVRSNAQAAGLIACRKTLKKKTVIERQKVESPYTRRKRARVARLDRVNGVRYLFH